MNQPYARVNQPYATLTLASALREMFGVQLYKNNARALLSRILNILNLDWLQHARSVRGVYECWLCIYITAQETVKKWTLLEPLEILFDSPSNDYWVLLIKVLWWCYVKQHRSNLDYWPNSVIFMQTNWPIRAFVSLYISHKYLNLVRKARITVILQIKKKWEPGGALPIWSDRYVPTPSQK